MNQINGSQYQNSPFLTIDQAAARAGVNRASIDKWIREGLPQYGLGPLPVIRLSQKLVRVDVVDLDAWIRMRKTEGTPSSSLMKSGDDIQKLIRGLSNS